MDYREYTIMLSEYRLKEELHERLRQLVEGNSQVEITTLFWLTLCLKKTFRLASVLMPGRSLTQTGRKWLHR